MWPCLTMKANCFLDTDIWIRAHQERKCWVCCHSKKCHDWHKNNILIGKLFDENQSAKKLVFRLYSGIIVLKRYSGCLGDEDRGGWHVGGSQIPNHFVWSSNSVLRAGAVKM